MDLAPTAEIVALPFSPEKRLRLALARLDAALDAQRESVAAWRVSLGRLGEAVGTLDGSVRRYRDTLGSLATQVGEVNAQARALEAWADGVLADAAEH